MEHRRNMINCKFENKRYVLSISYGDYTSGVGGTDRVIKAHQEMLNQEQFSYLFIYPLQKINNKFKISEECFWGCICDGKKMGILSTDKVMVFLRQLQKEDYKLLAIFIHHLKHVSLNELDKIVSSSCVPIYFYLHDYTTICPLAGLVTSKDCFCGTSFPNEAKCNGCEFYSDTNVKRLFAIQDLLEGLHDRIQYIAPSDTAKNEWVKCYPENRDKVRVIYHQTRCGEYNDHTVPAEEEPLKVAFVGYQKNLKGWTQWSDAVYKAVNNGCKMKFYQFGTTNVHFPYIQEVSVDFKNSLTSMTDALRSYGIHVAVLWSIWPETYSYTFYEAWAANTFILCNELSGNICDQVRQKQNGLVCSSPDDLVELLSDEDYLRRQVKQYRNNITHGPMLLSENPEIFSLLDDNIDGKIEGYGKVNHLIEIKSIVYNFLMRINDVFQKRRRI